MKSFTIFWLTGEREVINGFDIADAMNNAGYSSGVLGAFDFYVSGDNRNYIWNGKTWIKKLD